MRRRVACIITSPMECHCIPYREVPHTTRLFSTYVEAFPKIAEFYEHAPDERGVRSSARCAQIDSSTRQAVANVLREQNRRLAGDASVERNIERFERGAVAILGGQQVGLFGGPAYTLYKALTAIHWATKLSRAGVEAVPIFWMATEDHDFAEVNHALWGGREGAARLELTVEESLAGRSVGKIPLGPPVGALVSHAARLLEGASAREIAGIVSQSYREGETFGSAFGKLLGRLFSGRGLILLDALDQRLHELSRAIYRQAAEQAEELTEELIARNKVLGRRGFHAQVKVTRQSTLLFLEVDGTRQPIRHRSGEFVAGDSRWSAAGLLGALEERPGAMTASVLLRPVIQDSLLPTAAYIGGPAEVAYFAQAQVVYKRLGVRMPAILPRASFTLVEPEVRRLLERYRLGFPGILKGRQNVRRKMESQFLPRRLAARFERDAKTLGKLLDGYRAPLTRTDRSLEGALGTAERKMLYQFEKLRQKAGRAQNFRTGVIDRHERQILDALFPHHGLQERGLSLLPFLARHGRDLLEGLAKEMQKECAGHQVISL